MSNEGAWPQVFWIVADGMVDGGLVESGLRVEDFYGTALDCVAEEFPD